MSNNTPTSGQESHHENDGEATEGHAPTDEEPNSSWSDPEKPKKAKGKQRENDVVETSRTYDTQARTSPKINPEQPEKAKGMERGPNPALPKPEEMSRAHSAHPFDTPRG